MKEGDKKYLNIGELAKILGISQETARMMGMASLTNQVLAQQGLGNVVHRCEDSRNQWPGDAIADIVSGEARDDS